MNKDQMKGLAQYVAGKVQEHAGNLIGSPEHIVKGLTRQVAGKAQKGRGDVKQTIKDFNKDRPQSAWEARLIPALGSGRSRHGERSLPVTCRSS
jgi:uncharacterized protein YjbJ (UPF0337 family)